ncbi:CRISPR-associated endonuclease Cas1 [Gammaproteobacteria bacterium AB-CW1]|uniref:CRISPR-associated endonuclease Cas1 n=1 Tax=Natronospira elongata TaxID=3110268 RepID=A0AAP6JGM4_9GAMM|nr:CRISPR-associated endonuclease Cas1 [Gammaproteobacteria bacterium AB-CW1]
MHTVVIDKPRLRLSRERQSLLVHDEQGLRHRIPFSQMDGLLLSSKVQLDSSLLCHLSEAGIPVTALPARKGRACVMAAPPGATARRRRDQYLAAIDPARSLALARPFVAARLRGQQAVLRLLARRRPEHRRELIRAAAIARSSRRKLGAAGSLARLRGLEGRATRAYFQAWGRCLPASAGFAGRNRRPPRDPANAVLSYLSTILVREAETVCHQVGLDPMQGYLHEADWNRPALACDLMEVVRHRVELMTQELFSQGILRSDQFSKATQHGCRMNPAARRAVANHWAGLRHGIRRQLLQSIYHLIREL